MQASLGFMVQAVFGIVGSQSLLHLVALSERLNEWSLVLIFAYSVSPNCILYLVVVSIVVLSHSTLCPVVREWWTGADSVWENSVGLSK